MIKKFAVVVAGLFAVTALIAGCGSGDDESSTSTSSLTKAEFIKQADSICTQGNKDINTGFEEFSKENDLDETKEPPKPVQEEAIETILIPAINRQIEEVRALGTPEGDDGQLEEVLTSEEEAIAEGEDDPLKLFETTAKQREANKMARDYGLTVCGSESEG
jgi:hypothetical protein